MVEDIVDEEFLVIPDVSQLITEDNEPVDNLPSEKQQRLSTEPLYSSDVISRPFLAAANVALYHQAKNGSAIVPDVMLSLDVTVSDDFWEKQHRAYLTWVFGKHPEVVMEIVSNKKGAELGTKKGKYARIGVWYYVVYDPHLYIQDEKVVVYELQNGTYRVKSDLLLDAVGLGLQLWEGEFEDVNSEWLRWTDLDGNLIPTGKERAEVAEGRAEVAESRAEAAEERAARLIAQLRALGIDPDIS